jgi:TetR/AcrR family transcriptional regulator, mexJK operon transcriptional repressor
MRTADPEHRRRQVAKILGNARHLFARDGFDRVSMDRIAAACGLTKPVLYYYFEDKRAVLLAVLEAHWAEQAAVLEAFRASGDVRATLSQLARLILREASRPDTGDVIRIVLAEAARHPEIGRAFFRNFGPIFETRLLGAIRPHLAPGLSDEAVLALFHQFVGSLAHYSLLQQVLRPGRRHLPGRDTFIALVVESFTRASGPSPEGRASAA